MQIVYRCTSIRYSGKSFYNNNYNVIQSIKNSDWRFNNHTTQNQREHC